MVPLHFFAKECVFKNSQRAPYHIFGTMRLTGDQKKSKKKFQINSEFFKSQAGTAVL